jgi:hypothetical protein
MNTHAVSPVLTAGKRACAAWLAAAAVASCGGAPDIDVVLYDPENIRDGAQYAQLAVFTDGCPSDQYLAFGEVRAAVMVQTVPADGVFSELGKLKKGTYGFVGLLRANDCAVLGVGCTEVDFEKHRHITVQLDPVIPPAGACDTSLGIYCTGGICQ